MTWCQLIIPPLVAALPLVAVAVWGIIVARGTLKVIARQAVSMRRQTRILRKSVEAADKNAKAAKISADALINSERAWLLETIIFPNQLPVQPPVGDVIVATVSFTFKNQGRTPARIIDIKLRFQRIQAPNALPAAPQYETTSMPELGAYGRMIASNETVTVARFLEERATFAGDDRLEIIAKRLSVFAYGVIEYEALGKKCSTQFCYVWHEPTGLTTSGDVAEFRKGGPSEYNKAT